MLNLNEEIIKIGQYSDSTVKAFLAEKVDDINERLVDIMNMIDKDWSHQLEHEFSEVQILLQQIEMMTNDKVNDGVYITM